jgi:hypothetical protein
LAELRAREPSAVGGVHIATIRFDAAAANGPPVVDLGLSPAVVAGPVALVIRLDDSVNQAWDADPTFAADLDAALSRVLAMARRSAPGWREVQIDYDVPNPRLEQWANVLDSLTALSGEHVWVTSLVSHLRDPGYGDLFRRRVEGHILQVFDTGDQPVDAAEITRLAAAAKMQYRLGVGAFERVGADGAPATANRDWFAQVDLACPAPLCQELWVFPAGREYVGLLPGR